MTTQYDFTDLALGATETDYTDIGDIKAPVGASRITGICAENAQETGYTTLGCLGIAKLEWTGAGQIDGIPVAIVAAVATGQVFYKPVFVPVSIPIIGGHTEIACSVKLTLAQTGTTQHGKICLRFE